MICLINYCHSCSRCTPRPFRHHREELWTVPLCWMYEVCVPRETKGPSVAESATVQCHHSAEWQTEWVPTHSLSTHCAALVDTTGKLGCVSGSRSRNLNSGSCSGLYRTHIWGAWSTCGVFVWVNMDYKSYMTFAWISLVTHNHHFVFCCCCCCRNCWIRFFKGAATERQMKTMTRQILQHSQTEEVNFALWHWQYNFWFQCRWWHSSSCLLAPDCLCCLMAL